jgi:hypothetical protein
MDSKYGPLKGLFGFKNMRKNHTLSEYGAACNSVICYLAKNFVAKNAGLQGAFSLYTCLDLP